MTRTVAALTISGLLALALLTAGCAAADPSSDATAPTPSQTTASPAPSPSSTLPRWTPTPSEAAIALPTSCRKILSDAVIAEFGSTPLNDPAVGGGVQPDGSLICNWRDPGADTTFLSTRISRLAEDKAATLFADLVSQSYQCAPVSDGSRCQKTWQNTQYPVTDGRTVFWRGGILIDTSFSNLAPYGYTQSIVDHLWP